MMWRSYLIFLLLFGASSFLSLGQTVDNYHGVVNVCLKTVSSVSDYENRNELQEANPALKSLSWSKLVLLGEEQQKIELRNNLKEAEGQLFRKIENVSLYKIDNDDVI